MSDGVARAGIAVGAAGLQRLLRRRRVRADLRAPQPDRAAGAQDGSRAARTTLRAMENVSLMMAGAQLGITICSLGLGAVGEPASPTSSSPSSSAPGCPRHWCTRSRSSLALVVVVVLHVVLGEMVPKNIAIAGPERSALVLAPALVAVVGLLRPVIVGAQRHRQRDAAAPAGRAPGRGQLDLHPRGGRGAGGGVARRGSARGRRVRPARRCARLHREDRRPRC